MRIINPDFMITLNYGNLKIYCLFATGKVSHVFPKNESFSFRLESERSANITLIQYFMFLVRVMLFFTVASILSYIYTNKISPF